VVGFTVMLMLKHLLHGMIERRLVWGSWELNQVTFLVMRTLDRDCFLHKRMGNLSGNSGSCAQKDRKPRIWSAISAYPDHANGYSDE
jgi:hypothetical protein